MTDRLELRQDAYREAQRVATILDQLIRSSKLSKSALEERIGLSLGHLSQLLGGRVEIKMWHVCALLDVLDAEVCLFFKLAFPPWEALKRSKDQEPDIRAPLAAGLELLDETVTRLELVENALQELGAFEALDARREGQA